MKKSLLIPVLSILLMACTFVWPIQLPTPTVATSAPALPVVTATLPLPPAPTPSWSMYENAAYGYSISHPNGLPVNVVSADYVEIGDKIVINVLNADPLSMQGDAPVIENSTEVKPSLYVGRLDMGYIGSVGGRIPQQLRRYVFQNDGSYYVFSFYALGLKATEGDITQVAPLYPEEVQIFDNIVQTLEFK